MLKKIRSENAVAKAMNTLLEGQFMAPIEDMTSYSRVHDDCDGDPSQSLDVIMSPDGDIHLVAGTISLRFRTFHGGGMSPRVRNALIVLAEAIRRDNADHPQHFSQSA